MIVKADKQNLGPKVLVQGVLSFDHREIIAGGDDASVEHDQVIFARSKNDALLAAGEKREEEGRASDTAERAK